MFVSATKQKEFTGSHYLHTWVRKESIWEDEEGDENEDDDEYEYEFDTSEEAFDESDDDIRLNMFGDKKNGGADWCILL